MTTQTIRPERLRSAGRQLMTLPRQVAERIFAAIASGEYAPGERVREETLAEQFEVSRGTVREALRLLEKDSVLRILPNRGAHVTKLSIKDVNDIFEIRRDLLGVLVRRLGPRDDAFIAGIDADVRELEALAKEAGADDAYVAVSCRLERRFADNCGNDRLGGILDILARQTQHYSNLALATAARRRESARIWRALLKALKADDVNGAAIAIECLIDASRHEAASQLQATEPGARSAAPGTAHPLTRPAVDPT